MTGRPLANRAQSLPSGSLHCRGRRGCRRLSGARPAAGTVRQRADEKASQNDSQCGDRVRIMPFGTKAANRAPESLVAVWRRVVQ